MAFAAVAAVAVIGGGAAAFVTLGGSQGSASEVDANSSPATTALAQTEEHPEDHSEDHSVQDQPSIEPDPTVPTTGHAPPPTCAGRRAACAPSSPTSGSTAIATSSTTPPPGSIRSSTARTQVRGEHDHHVHFFFDTTDAGNRHERATARIVEVRSAAWRR